MEYLEEAPYGLLLVRTLRYVGAVNRLWSIPGEQRMLNAKYRHLHKGCVEEKTSFRSDVADSTFPSHVPLFLQPTAKQKPRARSPASRNIAYVGCSSDSYSRKEVRWQLIEDWPLKDILTYTP